MVPQFLGFALVSDRRCCRGAAVCPSIFPRRKRAGCRIPFRVLRHEVRDVLRGRVPWRHPDLIDDHGAVLGGWIGPWLPPIVWFLIKMFAFICFFILLRASLPRLRFDQLMSWGWKVMLPLALLNLLVTGAVVLAWR